MILRPSASSLGCGQIRRFTSLTHRRPFGLSPRLKWRLIQEIVTGLDGYLISDMKRLVDRFMEHDQSLAADEPTTATVCGIFATVSVTRWRVKAARSAGDMTLSEKFFHR